MDAINNVLSEVKTRDYQATLDTALRQRFERQYECPLCKDEEYIVDGWSAKTCTCAAQKRLQRRMNNAAIPFDFAEADMNTYVPLNEKQGKMFALMRDYLEHFEELKTERANSFGFLAVAGEQRLREIKDPIKRLEAQREYNNYGVGKTYLTMAAAKQLVHRGYTTLVISDVTYMEKLAESKAYGDGGETHNKLLWGALECDVLVWDDLGKAKHSETKEKLYFRIIDERFERRKPILWTSNEDDLTLSDKIGPAALSRLLGMSSGRYFAVTGQDQRRQAV